jgi:hypothetical protein
MYVLRYWEFHLATPPKCQILPSSIPKTAHVKFRATSGSLSTTLWCYYRGQNQVVVMISNYAQVERRSVTFLDQTMSRGEAFGLNKYIKIIHYLK